MVGAQRVDAGTPALDAVEAEAAGVAEVVAHPRLGGGDGGPHRVGGPVEGGPGDLAPLGVELPEADEPTAVDYGVRGQVEEGAGVGLEQGVVGVAVVEEREGVATQEH